MMKNLGPKHYLLIAGFLAASGSLLGSLHGWDEVLKPSVLGGFAGQLGILITSVFVDKPAA